MTTADRIIEAFKRRQVSFETNGQWRTRVRPGGFDPHGAIAHHTAGHKDLAVIVNGRPDLNGPLANFYVPKSGKIVVVSAGKCNHAGQISAKVYDDMLNGRAPKGDAGKLGLPDDGPVGNGLLFGFECENYGDGKDPWPRVQVDSLVLAFAALADEWGWGPARFIAHREATRRKPDPRGLNMGQMRSRIAALLDEWR